MLTRCLREPRTWPSESWLPTTKSHILNVVSLKLANAGFEILTAGDGQEALEVAAASVPDLIITDFQMPILSGLEMCKQLRQSVATAGIPAIMLTARGYTLEPADMAIHGILRMLSKPFSPRQLLATVNEVLESVAVAT